MFPSPSKIGSSRRVPAEHPDELQSPSFVHPISLPPLRSLDIPSPTSQSHSNYGTSDASASLRFNTFPPPSNYGFPTPCPIIIHQPQIVDEQVLASRIQRPGNPFTPPSTYTGGFFSTFNQGSPPVPRLRPASWGSPSQEYEDSEDYQITKSKSSVDFRGHSGGDDEGLPFGRRTLPPLPNHQHPWSLGARTPSNDDSSSSRGHSTDFEDVSSTDSLPIDPFLADHPNEENRHAGSPVRTDAGDVTRGSTSDQPEASTSARRLPSVSQPEHLPDFILTKPGCPQTSSQGAAHSRRRQRDTLPEPNPNGSIECGWKGCVSSDLNYDQRSVVDHVRLLHGGSGSEQRITCRWVRVDTGMECGSELLPSSLSRHTLDIHTNLLMKTCPACGKQFRKDTFRRHNCHV